MGRSRRRNGRCVSASFTLRNWLKVKGDYQVAKTCPCREWGGSRIVTLDSGFLTIHRSETVHVQSVASVHLIEIELYNLEVKNEAGFAIFNGQPDVRKRRRPALNERKQEGRLHSQLCSSGSFLARYPH